MTRFQRWFLYLSTAVAAVSGVVYFCMKRFLTPLDPWAVINHPLEPWALKLHIISAPIMLFAVGLITTQHIWRSLKSSLPTGRRSGLIATAVFVPLVATGYLIQVFTNATVLEVLAWSHLVLGITIAWALAAHRRVLRPRRLKRRHGSLPVLKADGPDEPADAPSPVSPAMAGAGASRSVSGRRVRRSGSHRPRTDRREESSSEASS